MSLIVHDSEAKLCVEALHQAFFEGDGDGDGDDRLTAEFDEENLRLEL